ncbi:UNVERIFIED_CONTAM: hypothetical protein FKN15_005699 [Acipenser sinensis]
MKQRFDRARRVKPPDRNASDLVRAKRPHRGDKLQSFWSSPLRVSHHLGPATFQLQDGSRWHASRLRKVPPPESQPVPFGHHGTGFWPSSADAVTDGGGPAPVGAAAWPSRTRQHPGYLQDFVTSFHT